MGDGELSHRWDFCPLNAPKDAKETTEEVFVCFACLAG